MSLIRALSNPEGMYVTQSGIRGRACYEITSGCDWPKVLSNCGPDDSAMVVPKLSFERLCKKAEYVDETPVSVRGIAVVEIVVDTKTGQGIEADILDRKKWKNAIFGIRLSYKDKFVVLYRVTWEYIRRNALERH